ncbi:MAG: amidohydrolase [Bacteroidales bacterium]|nr:amidohydrolase [Bacteroidales bacterium]MCM1416214.1 amidohydrolase [bacterium]MCM1424226.1 amidohydrolase [bacterium]
MLLIHGNIKTMAGTDHADGYVQTAAGKIVSVGGMETCPTAGPEEEILDVQGAFVMPGIVEAHCHMGITEEKKGMEGDDCNETVDPITPQLQAIDAINPMDAAFNDALAAGITSAMIGPGSANVVGGQFAFIKTHGRCIDRMIVKAPAAMKVAFGENPKVNYSGQGKSPSTRMAIAAMLREELTKAVNYREKRKENGKEPPDPRYECWLPVLNGEIPLKAHAHRADDILTAVRIAKEFGLRMTIDHCSEGHLIADELKEAGYPAIVGPDMASRNKIEVQNMAFKTAGILARKGILTAITTDHPVSRIQFLPICAGLAVKSGMDPEEGLRAITINAAKICGVAERLGSLEPGKDADIAVFTGNPMEVFTETLYTFIDGKIVYRKDEKYDIINPCEKVSYGKNQ